MSFFDFSNCKLKKQIVISNSNNEILLANYNGNPLLIKATSKAKNLISDRVGYVYQFADILNLGRIQLTDKTAISLNNLNLFFWGKLPNYQLIFESSSWIKDLQLQIYQSNTMSIYSDPNITTPSNNSSSATPSTVPNSATSVSLLAANANRKSFTITNNSNQDLFVEFGATASIAAFAIRLPKLPGSNIPAVYEGDEYTGAIAGIWQAAGSGGAMVREFT
jgi:hypothetical protein